MQLRDTIITVGRRVMPELDDSTLIKSLVAKSVNVDEIELLPLKEIAINKAVDIKVDKKDSIVKISLVHPSFIQEGQEYYSQYKQSLIHEPTPKTDDMNTLVHDINGYFVLAFFIYKFKVSVYPRMIAMLILIWRVWKEDLA